jgi:hypothetical protein
MKNKISVIGKITLNMFLVFTLLNISTCGNNTSSMKKVEQYSAQKDYDLSSPSESHICPFCQGNYRSFYTLSNEENAIILLCEGCQHTWLDPKNIELSGAASSKDLKKEFNKGFKELFKNANGHWSIKEEVNESKWNEVMHKNLLLLYDSYDR